MGRTTGGSCGKTNPPYGHVNSFTERRLLRMFSGLRLISKSFVGSNKEVTNPISTSLMDLAGNPWGTYDQDEPCCHCKTKLIRPGNRRQTWQRICSGIAVRMNRAQSFFNRPHGNWIHLVFSKRNGE